ncbi:MAG: hypothetical protein ACP5HG_08310 [Anaerolineae bacterium]
MNRRRLLSLTGLLLLAALACGPLTSGNADTAGVDVRVVNRSPDDVCYVLISPSDSDRWGDDQLAENEVIDPDGDRLFSMDAGTYDVRIERCDEAAMATAWEVDGDTTVTIGGPREDIRLLVVNESDTEICYVFISPTSGDEWGDDQMGDLETLQPDGKRIFYVESDVYDLQVADCEGATLTEEYEVDLTEDLTWTLHD